MGKIKVIGQKKIRVTGEGAPRYQSQPGTIPSSFIPGFGNNGIPNLKNIATVPFGINDTKDQYGNTIEYDQKGKPIQYDWTGNPSSYANYTGRSAKDYDSLSSNPKSYSEYNTMLPSALIAGMSGIRGMAEGLQGNNLDIEYAKRLGQTDAFVGSTPNKMARGNLEINTGAQGLYTTPVQFAGRPTSEFVGYPAYQPQSFFRKEGGELEQYQTKGQVTRPPIYTQDPNDPRLRAFNDSSYMNKYGETEKAFLQNPQTNEKSWNDWHKKASNYRVYKDENNESIYGVLDGAEQAKRRLALYNYNTKWAKDKNKINYPNGFINEKDYNKAYFDYLDKGPISRDFSDGTILGALGFGSYGNSYQYSKPVQPVIYKKPQQTKLQTSTSQKPTTKPKSGGWKPLTSEIAKGRFSGDISNMIYRETGDPDNPYNITGAPSKPEPTLKRKTEDLPLLPYNSQSSTPQLKIMQHPNIQLPPIQQGKYKVDYFDPTEGTEVNGGWHTKSFMSDKEAGDYMHSRPMYGPSMTQRVEYSEGGLTQYQDGNLVLPGAMTPDRPMAFSDMPTIDYSSMPAAHETDVNYSRPQGQEMTADQSEASMPFAMPLKLKDVKITSGFGSRKAPKAGASTEHNGIDLAAPLNTPVYSPMDGVVEKIYFNDKGGKQLVIHHSDGSRSGFAHLNGYDVNLNDNVSKGQLIALSGNTGNSTGPHLHFTFRNPKGEPVDPSYFFDINYQNQPENKVSNLNHNNPGNIHIGGFAQGYGATAGRKDGAGKVAIFPDMQTGMTAMQDLIFGNAYNNLTVSQARNKWVNGSPNATTSSTTPIVKAIGGDFKLNELSGPQRKKLVSEFIKWEDRGVYDNLKTKGLIYKEGGEYELDDNEIQYILANGGQIEYL